MHLNEKQQRAAMRSLGTSVLAFDTPAELIALLARDMRREAADYRQRIENKRREGALKRDLADLESRAFALEDYAQRRLLGFVLGRKHDKILWEDAESE
jgi:hypothetical protein